MKVRIGVAAGPGVVDDPGQFLSLVDAADDLGYDSLWVPDVITTPTLDPLVALAAATGRRQKLKVGTHLIFPGRNPVLLAKQLATLDQLSNGRLLLLAVLGLRNQKELAAQGVEAADRSSMLEEMLHIMWALWNGERVTFHGKHYHYEDVELAVRPVQSPLEVWLGGQVPAALRRCGRIGEGWMPGLCSPQEAAEARSVIEAAAAEAGRVVDGEHFGMNLTWVENEIHEEVAAAVAARRPDMDPADAVAIGVDGLAARMEAFIDVGFSKFVIRPAVSPPSWPEAIEAVAPVLTLQS